MLKHGLKSAAVDCPVGNVEACGMSGFDSLTWALDGWFEASLCDLPEVLRQRVEREFITLCRIWPSLRWPTALLLAWHWWAPLFVRLLV